MFSGFANPFSIIDISVLPWIYFLIDLLTFLFNL